MPAFASALAATAGTVGVDPLAVLAVLAAGVLYRRGIARLAARGRRWPRSRSILFGLGLLAVLVATNGPLAAADDQRLTAHMAQHALLGMVAPLLLALSAPLTLALQTAGPRVRAWLRRALHGSGGRVLSNPLAGMVLFGASLFALSLRNGIVHAAVHIHFFLSGAAFLWPVLAADAVPARPSPPVRLLAVFLTLPLHAVLGLALLGSQALLADGWYGRKLGAVAALRDQHAAGGLLWAAGEILGLACAAVVLAQWMAADEREAARTDRRLDRLDRVDHLAGAEGA